MSVENNKFNGDSFGTEEATQALEKYLLSPIDAGQASCEPRLCQDQQDQPSSTCSGDEGHDAGRTH